MTEAPARVPLVEVHDLIAPGQPLPFRVLDGQGRMLLAAGQKVLDVRQLQALLERGACVEYDAVQEVRRERAAAAAARSGLTPSSRKRTLFDAWEQRTWELDALLKLVGRDPALASQLEAFAAEHVALVDKQLDAALFLCIRQDDRRFALYGLTHALHTATVAVLCGRQLEWPAERVQRVVGAALTMNVSMLELQAQMAEQSDPPTKRQLDLIRTHTTRSAQMLRDSGIGDAEWLSTVEDHHEHPGGGGYPRGATEVGEMAHLLRAADVFMAKISPRALRAPLLPQVAARQLFQEEKGGPVAAALIKGLGVYPPGDFVRLKNGEAAIVVQRTAASNAPIVAVLADPGGRPVHGAPRRETAQPDFAIAGPLTDRAHLPRVLPEQVYGLVEP
jgi:HD-GYP domain-containing protein (c-di-GMP phosphodiesterase class II)